MKTEIDILNDMVTNLKVEVINSLHENGRFATGHTAQELQEVVSDKYAALLAPYWIDSLETGRKPTPPGTPASDPTLRENLAAWLSVRGIPENAAYAIANKIHKYGYPGKPGVLSVPLSNDNIDSVLAPGIDDLAMIHQQKVADLFNVFDEI